MFHILFRESFTLIRVIGSVSILVLLQTFTAIRSEVPWSLRSRCIKGLTLSEVLWLLHNLQFVVHQNHNIGF